MTKEKVICPCCNAFLKYKKYKNTHIWICKDCPLIMFEYYNDKNLKNLVSLLNKNKKRISKPKERNLVKYDGIFN